MPRYISISQGQWMPLKPLLERWYLDADLTADQVIHKLANEKNFLCSCRQLKSCFSKWGWYKKVEPEEYMAMNVVLEKHDATTIFLVPKKTGRELKEMNRSYVKKEVNRKRNNAGRSGNSLPPEPTLREAVARLDERGVCVRRGSIAPPIAIALSSILAHPPAEDGSTVSVSSITETAYADDGTSELNDRNFPQQIPRLRLAPGQVDLPTRPRQVDRFPYPGAFLASLTTTILPQTPGNGLVEGLRRNLAPEAVRVVSSRYSTHSDDFLSDLPELFAELTCDLDPADVRRQSWEAFLGVQLAAHYRQHDPDSSKQLIIEFAAYYVQQCLAGFETLDSFDRPDRLEARDKLTEMLQQNNAYVLPTIFWVSTVLGAHDKLDQMAAFYHDCWYCIERTRSPAAGVIRPVILSMILKIQGMQTEPDEEERVMVSPEHRLREERSTFDQNRAFLQSIAYLSAHGDGDSPTAHLLHCYYAWHLQQSGEISDIEESLRILLTHLERAERTMGTRHLVSVNAHYLLAQAYEKQGEVNLAQTDLRLALLRLEGCPKPLRAYQYHLLAKLAELLLKQNDIQAALWSFEEVFNFRLSTFGACNNRTWVVAHSVFGILERQGHGHEARRRRSEFLAQREEEYRRTYWRNAFQ
ncbi:hypothetical protein LTR70_003415 [Exophiala xenobiotica]|uniref:Clr5 domain-containing protein n=1 Tax=Lithohypha guttulata TaxID=1690604 RepID=A0ABR0KGE7_9EURO|nr:hypothetical protein LTR24_002962 [Lithohypha guttulata]KAK5323553.1 hypothetical protein LTR70_003415 [Exophiala xenobiotica]